MRRARDKQAETGDETFWLDVPAADEGIVMTLGATWEPSIGRWWASGLEAARRFARWRSTEQQEPSRNEPLALVVLGLLSECRRCGRSGSSIIGLVEQGEEWRISPVIRLGSDAMLRVAEQAISAEARTSWSIGGLVAAVLEDGSVRLVPSCFACGAVLEHVRDEDLPREIEAFGHFALHGVSYAYVAPSVWADLQAEARTALGPEGEQ